MTERSRWLIVDDDTAFAETVARRLTHRGDEATVAHDAAAALQLAQAVPPHRVLLDLRLGTESGLRVLPELRRLLPNARIVILTGFGSIATAVQAMRDGADHYLPKPVRLTDILHAFDNAAKSATKDYEPMSPRRLEWEHLQRVLTEEGGNVSRAARRLGMHRRTLQRKLAKKPPSQ